MNAPALSSHADEFDWTTPGSLTLNPLVAFTTKVLTTAEGLKLTCFKVILLSTYFLLKPNGHTTLEMLILNVCYKYTVREVRFRSGPCLSWALFLNLNTTFQVQGASPQTFELEYWNFMSFGEVRTCTCKCTARKTELEFRTCTLSISAGDFEIRHRNWHCLD